MILPRRWAGDRLVTASYDGSVRVLDAGASPMAFRLALSDEEAEFSALDVSSDGATAYLGDKDGGLVVADLRASGGASITAALHDRKINTLHVRPSKGPRNVWYQDLRPGIGRGADMRQPRCKFKF